MKPNLIPSTPEKVNRIKAQKIYQQLEEKFGIPIWREPLSPVDELVSTILSQNTNDTNRDRAFNNLRSLFPTWESVRDAPESEIIDAIRIAGLANQKGPRIQAVLRQITQEYGKLSLEFLKNMEKEDALIWLKNQKGVGPKTAAIVLQFSIGIPAFPVDTHIYRVTGRTGIRPEKMTVERTHEWMEQLLEPAQYGPGHLNIIHLGREICHARNPVCPVCPLNRLCDYYAKLSSEANG